MVGQMRKCWKAAGTINAPSEIQSNNLPSSPDSTYRQQARSL
jgi:hypothetical protein